MIRDVIIYVWVHVRASKCALRVINFIEIFSSVIINFELGLDDHLSSHAMKVTIESRIVNLDRPNFVS